MSEFSYQLQPKIIPPEAKRGDWIKISARCSNVKGTIKTVFVSVDGYGIIEILPRQSDDAFTLQYSIPYEATSGNYKLTFYAKDTNGEKGPQVTETFRVL